MQHLFLKQPSLRRLWILPVLTVAFLGNLLGEQGVARAERVTLLCQGETQGGETVHLQVHPLYRSSRADAVVVFSIAGEETAFPTTRTVIPGTVTPVDTGDLDREDIYESEAHQGLKLVIEQRIGQLDQDGTPIEHIIGGNVWMGSLDLEIHGLSCEYKVNSDPN